MDYKKYGNSIYARFDKGDEILSLIMDICRKEHILSATYSGIGCCSDIVVAAIIPENNEFMEHKKSGVLELTSLMGNITSDAQDTIYHHTHAMFTYHNSNNELSTIGGHLTKAVVLYTAEIKITPVENGVIRRKKDNQTGISVWNLQ